MSQESFNSFESQSELAPDQDQLQNERDKTELNAKRAADFVNENYEKEGGVDEYSHMDMVHAEAKSIENMRRNGYKELIVEGENLKEDDIGPLKVHQMVTVARTSGEKEKDWFYMGASDTGELIVRKKDKETGETLTKRYPANRISELLT